MDMLLEENVLQHIKYGKALRKDVKALLVKLILTMEVGALYSATDG